MKRYLDTYFRRQDTRTEQERRIDKINCLCNLDVIIKVSNGAHYPKYSLLESLDISTKNE